MSPKLKQRHKVGAPRVEARPAPAHRKDAVLIHGVSEDGETMAVLRAREDRVEAGLVRSVKAGEPLRGELVKLTPRPEFPLLCDVEVQVPEGVINASGGSDSAASCSRADPRSSTAAVRSGPAQVATDSYRANWDAIWSKPRTTKKSLAN